MRLFAARQTSALHKIDGTMTLCANIEGTTEDASHIYMAANGPLQYTMINLEYAEAGAQTSDLHLNLFAEISVNIYDIFN